MQGYFTQTRHGMQCYVHALDKSINKNAGAVARSDCPSNNGLCTVGPRSTGTQVHWAWAEVQTGNHPSGTLPPHWAVEGTLTPNLVTR